MLAVFGVLCVVLNTRAGERLSGKSLLFNFRGRLSKLGRKTNFSLDRLRLVYTLFNFQADTQFQNQSYLSYELLAQLMTES